MVAKHTQAKCGKSNHAAVLEKLEKHKMVSIMDIIIKTISTSANAGELKWKKKVLHQKLRNSCAKNNK